MSATTTGEVISVGTYAERLNTALSHAGTAVVEGEVQEVKTFGKGVLSFTLTDGEARLPCKWLPWENGRRPLTHRPRDGDQVRVRISHASWYAAGGRAEVVISDVRLTGEGELLAARAQLLARLSAEGLTNPADLPPLPPFPRAVGLIAGVESEAYNDVIRGLRDRFPAVPVVSCCCRIQGAGAPQAMIAALGALSRQAEVDVIVIARGGGSVQDLAAFDDESLCRAIRAVDIPVVTAVGHTANNPVCNHITHHAFVPRHAADIVVRDRRDLLRDVGDASDAMTRAVADIQQRASALAVAPGLNVLGRLAAFRTTVLQSASIISASADVHVRDGEVLIKRFDAGAAQRAASLRADVHRAQRDLDAFASATSAARRLATRPVEDLGRLAEALASSSARMLKSRRDNLTRAIERMTAERVRAANRHIAVARANVNASATAIGRSVGRHEQQAKNDADALSAVLAAADFRRRGWLLATDASGHGITRIDDVQAGDPVHLHLEGGEASAVISETQTDRK